MQGARSFRAALVRVAQDLETYDRRATFDEVIALCAATTPSVIGMCICCCLPVLILDMYIYTHALSTCARLPVRVLHVCS